ncbi:hypothetical protein F4809DRAFT_638382 [Biscogniauxia mediterranea]|nr:hypothetical protein F4809DRAFT_638382 [Biscogniauxia mediterranea]
MAERGETLTWGHGAFASCLWNTTHLIKFTSAEFTALQFVDVHFERRPSHLSPVQLQREKTLLVAGDNGYEPITIEDVGSEDAFRFILDCLEATERSGCVRVARLIVPMQEGTIIRSDIIPLRLRDAFWADKVTSFSKPLQFFPGNSLSLDSTSFPELFRSSAGGILLHQATRLEKALPDTANTVQEIERDFEDKMSLSWISPKPISRKRLVLVGRSNQDPAGGGWTQFACQSAQALGIDLVIIDKAGGWLERSEFVPWYEALLPAGSWWSNPPRDDMADRIVETVESYGKKTDGIITFIEAYQASVSCAAHRLGLSHQPTESYELATDKHRLGLFEGRQSFRASNTEDALAIATRENLTYPLILKPCFGINSEGVVRVDDQDDIPAAVETIHKTFCKEFLIEKYCEGPEVDINLVVIDKEVLLCEVCDDFPKGADTNNAGASGMRKTFHETNMVFPSALPPRELEKLRDSVSDTILRLGFTSGIYHVEARIEGASVDYRTTDEIVDLEPVSTGTKKPVTPWVLEINPRPPGVIASQINASVYGVDYWGIAMLVALDDKGRARSLSHPFPSGAQHHGVLVLISADFDQDTCEGVFGSDDICEELLARRPDLKANINRRGCLLRRGQKIPHPSSGKNTFVAYFNVFSNRSRREALKIAREVREQVRYTFC